MSMDTFRSSGFLDDPSDPRRSAPHAPNPGRERPAGLRRPVDAAAADPLLIALQEVFTPGVDRLIWEPAPGVVGRGPAGTETLVRVDPAHLGAREPASETEPPWGMTVNAHSAMAMASGLLEARERQQDEYWIIVVLTEPSLNATIAQMSLRQLSRADSRLLIVVRQMGRAPHGDLTSDSPWTGSAALDELVTRLGFRCLDPIAESHADALKRALAGISQRGEPVVLVTCPSLASAVHDRSRHVAEPGLSVAGRARHAVSPYLQLALQELDSRCETDPQLIPLWIELIDDEIQVTSESGAWRCELADLNAHCRGLSAGGCHPVLVVDEECAGEEVLLAVRDLLDGGSPLTIILPPPQRGATQESEGSRRSVWLPFRWVAGSTVMTPRSDIELMEMLQFSRSLPHASVIQLPAGPVVAGLNGPVTREIEWGRAEILSDGRDLTVLAAGSAVQPALEAAAELLEFGVSISILNARFIAPVDLKRIREIAAESGGLLILESAEEQTGFAQYVAALLSDELLPQPLMIVSLPLAENDAEEAARAARSSVVQAVRRLLSPRMPELDPPADENVGNAGGHRVSQHWIDRETFGFPPEELRRQRDLAHQAKLSDEVEAWFQTYFQVGHRKRFLWQWCVHGAALTTLPSVREDLRDHVRDTKVLSIMLCVLLDDMADEERNPELLEALLAIVEKQQVPDMTPFTEADRRYAEVTLQLSEIYEARIRSYPRYAEFQDVLHFDLMQYFNTMRYSCLLNRHLELLNVAEHELYLPHAMHMMSFATLDLMCSPEFDVRELGHVREALWRAQCMGRVGNLLSTWQREIPMADFTSGVFSRAVIAGDLTIAQLREGNAEEVERAIIAGGHEKHYLNRWFYHRELLKSKIPLVRTVDLKQVLECQDRFLQMHLGCRGLI